MMLRWLPEDITVHNEDLEGNNEETQLCPIQLLAFHLPRVENFYFLNVTGRT